MGVLVMMLDCNNNNRKDFRNKVGDFNNNSIEDFNNILLKCYNKSKLEHVNNIKLCDINNNTEEFNNNHTECVNNKMENNNMTKVNINNTEKMSNNMTSINSNSKFECPVFHWPQHSFLIEHFRQRQDLLSSELQTKLESLDIFVREVTTANINCKISTAARNCGRLARNRIWFTFDIFLARNRPGLISDPASGIKKKRRTRRSKSKKNATYNEPENELEDYATVLKTEATLAIVETANCTPTDGKMRGV